MKNILAILISSIIFFSCKGEPIVKPVAEVIHSNFDSLSKLGKSNRTDAINPYWNCYENSNRKIEIVSSKIINDTLIKNFKGKIAKSDLNKNLILDELRYSQTDTSTYLDFEIFGYSQKRYLIKNTLEPYLADGEIVNLDNLSFENDKMMIIPYRHDLDGESTVLTLWSLQGDSLEYTVHFKNLFDSKNASIWPVQYFKTAKNSYLLGCTKFAEGGEYGESYWVAQILENHKLTIHTIFSTGGEYSDDTLKQLSYSRKMDNLIIYEKYFVNSSDNFSEKDYLSRKKVAIFVLK